MQGLAEFERLEDDYYRTYRAGQSPLPVALYPARCPRCLRGIRFPRLLSRMPGTTYGPRICSSCITWEQKWHRVEEARADRDRHLEEIG